MPEIHFIETKNQDLYLNSLMDWLKKDYEAKGQPSRHFWHNREVIKQSFYADNEAMVTVDNDNHVIGYMIWQKFAVTAEINIVEVKEEYRYQGLCRNMFNAFLKKFDDILMLTASVLEQAEAAFSKMGWEGRYDHNYNAKRFYKIVPTQSLEPVYELPSGSVIAICSTADTPKDTYVDLYRVRATPEKYQLKYFKLEFTKNQTLKTPIVIPFNEKGYVGLYYNKKLLADDIAWRLLENIVCANNFLIINQVKLQARYAINEPGFFKPVEQQTQYKRKHTNDSLGFSTAKKRKQNKDANSVEKEGENTNADNYLPNFSQN